MVFAYLFHASLRYVQHALAQEYAPGGQSAALSVAIDNTRLRFSKNAGKHLAISIAVPVVPQALASILPFCNYDINIQSRPLLLEFIGPSSAQAQSELGTHEVLKKFFQEVALTAKTKKQGHLSAQLSKSPTGIQGLDAVTGGGLPKGRPTLVAGGAGCGFLRDKLLDHKAYIDKHGQDLPEIRNWKWSNPK